MIRECFYLVHLAPEVGLMYRQSVNKTPPLLFRLYVILEQIVIVQSRIKTMVQNERGNFISQKIPFIIFIKNTCALMYQIAQEHENIFRQIKKISRESHS